MLKTKESFSSLVGKVFFLNFFNVLQKTRQFYRNRDQKHMDSKILTRIELDERKSEIVREKGAEKKWRRQRDKKKKPKTPI